MLCQTHIEQNVVLIRNVKYNKGSDDCEITERFLEFNDFHTKIGGEIAEMIENVLRNHGIDIKDCRGQGYDNGANMSGKVKGVEVQILKKNDLATFSPCASHILNHARHQVHKYQHFLTALIAFTRL